LNGDGTAIQEREMTFDTKWERYTDSRDYDAGQVICKEGEAGDDFYIIESGQVVISKESEDGELVVLGYRKSGEMFGEIALITASPRSATVTAAEPTTVRAMAHDDFWHLMKTDETLQQLVMQTVIERLLAADESRVLAEVWERRVHERFTNLTDENERMAEIMQLRQETIHFIVHDLRDPIGLARSALGMIEMAPGYDAESDIGRFVMMAAGGLQRMLNLVDSLLDVEQLTEGESALELEQVDMVALQESVIEKQQPIATSLQVELVSQVSPTTSLSHIRADRERVERVIANLIDNALKFTPPAGQVTVSLEQVGDVMEVAINDTGPGIPEDRRERVFERFVKDEEGSKAKGFGLGLSFCRSAVEAHGGTIHAEEGEGGIGTKFVFTLPAAG
jgi:signal transduction histidine kinase